MARPTEGDVCLLGSASGRWMPSRGSGMGSPVEGLHAVCGVQCTPTQQ